MQHNPCQIKVVFFAEIDKLILIFIWKYNDLKSLIFVKKTNLGDFTGSPVVKTCHFHHRVGVGLIPGLELRFPHAARCGQNVKKKKKLEDSHP